MSSNLKSLASDLTAAIEKYDAAEGDTASAERKTVIDLAKGIINEVKEPTETPFEYLISMGEMSVLRIFMDWEVLENIPETGSISYADLAAKVNASEVLLRRFAWMLVSTRMLKQIGEDHVAHSKFSPIYANKNPQGMWFQITFDETLLPSAQWPEYFKKYGRIEPSQNIGSPHAFGWREEDKSFWDIITADDKRLDAFNTGMQTLDSILPLSGMYPFKWIAENAHLVPDNAPLVVDVGGGKGHALQRMRQECPDITAERMVLQEREEVIQELEGQEDALGLRGVRLMVHDFFQEQVVKGSLIYYLRRILHDWSDEVCVVILSRLQEAMGPESRLLITEQVMPSPPRPIAAAMDIAMMNLAGKERTAKDWDSLAEKSGLRISKFWTMPGTDVAVIECRTKTEV